MPTYLFSFLLGGVAGLRSLTPLAAVSWAARSGRLKLEGTPLAFLGSEKATYILTALAIGELITDKLPQTPSRKSAIGFAARLVTGAAAGAALNAQAPGSIACGAVAGAAGAIGGTLGGYEFRTRLVKETGGPDAPIALLEDAIAIGSASAIACRES
jgi:uncharacterized membrane protein